MYLYLTWSIFYGVNLYLDLRIINKLKLNLFSEKSYSVALLKLVVCILLRVLGQAQGFRLTQHWFEYFIQ
jgi:hypothetical protein